MWVETVKEMHWTGWAEFRDLGMTLEKSQLGEIMQSVGEQKIVFSFLQVWSTFIFSIWNHPSFPYLLSSPSTYCNMGESHGGQLSSLLSQSALVDSLRGPNTTLRLNSHMAPQPRNGDVWGNLYGCCSHLQHHEQSDSQCPERTSDGHISEFFQGF